MWRKKELFAGVVQPYLDVGFALPNLVHSKLRIKEKAPLGYVGTYPWVAHGSRIASQRRIRGSFSAGTLSLRRDEALFDSLDSQCQSVESCASHCVFAKYLQSAEKASLFGMWGHRWGRLVSERDFSLSRPNASPGAQQVLPLGPGTLLCPRSPRVHRWDVQ